MENNPSEKTTNKMKNEKIIVPKEKNSKLKLHFKSQICAEDDCICILVSLTDYGKFISDEDGKLRWDLFDSNYQIYPRKDVLNLLYNQIEGTDFYQLNGGVLILAKNKSMEAGNIIEVDECQILRGAKTTWTIYEYLNEIKVDDERSMMVKIIATNDPDIRNNMKLLENIET